MAKASYTTITGAVVELDREEGTVAKRKGRFDPLTPGTVMLATCSVVRNFDGTPVWKEGRGGYRGWYLELRILANFGERGAKRFPIKLFMLVGGPDVCNAEIAASKGQLMRLMSCHHEDYRKLPEKLGHAVGPDDGIDGLVVPIALTTFRYKDFKTGEETGKLQQGATILSPDPRSNTYADYYRMTKARPVRRVVAERLVKTKPEPVHYGPFTDEHPHPAYHGPFVGGETIPTHVDYMPGWRFHKDSTAYRLCMRRLAKELGTEVEEDEDDFELKGQRKRCGGRTKKANVEFVKPDVKGTEKLVERFAAAVGPQDPNVPVQRSEPTGRVVRYVNGRDRYDREISMQQRDDGRMEWRLLHGEDRDWHDEDDFDAIPAAMVAKLRAAPELRPTRTAPRTDRPKVNEFGYVENDMDRLRQHRKHLEDSARRAAEIEREKAANAGVILESADAFEAKAAKLMRDADDNEEWDTDTARAVAAKWRDEARTLLAKAAAMRRQVAPAAAGKSIYKAA